MISKPDSIYLSFIFQDVDVEEYIGVIVEPQQLDRRSAEYSDTAMHHLYELDKKCLLVEDQSSYAEGEFDLVGYEEFQDYVGDRPAFITGSPEKIEEVAGMLDSKQVVLDRHIFSRGTIEVPSNKQVLKEEALSLIPMYEPDRQHVEIRDSEDVLRELGLEDADLMPLQALR